VDTALQQTVHIQFSSFLSISSILTFDDFFDLLLDFVGFFFSTGGGSGGGSTTGGGWSPAASTTMGVVTGGFCSGVVFGLGFSNLGRLGARLLSTSSSSNFLRFTARVEIRRLVLSLANDGVPGKPGDKLPVKWNLHITQ
jgi:hypothetical protein